MAQQRRCVTDVITAPCHGTLDNDDTRQTQCSNNTSIINDIYEHEIDTDEVGPGYEAQFDGWSREWNRVVKTNAEIREVTVTNDVSSSSL